VIVGGLVEVRLDAWPLVLVRIPEALDPPAIDSMIEGWERVFARASKFSGLIDTSALTQFPDAVGRKRIADWLTTRAMTEKLYCVGNAVVITSTLARAGLTAINWVRKPISPQNLVGSRVQGIEWCCERLVAAGLPLTPAIELVRKEAEPPRRDRAASSR
jgi:hypothetical protein